MPTLKESATDYVPKQTLNIADMDRTELHWPVEDRTGTDSEGKNFSYKVMIANELEYRVPVTVLEEIQKMLKLKPELKAVNVTKTGSGLNTRYAVNALE